MYLKVGKLESRLVDPPSILLLIISLPHKAPTIFTMSRVSITTLGVRMLATCGFYFIGAVLIEALVEINLD